MEFKTLRTRGSAEFTEKKSVFIGYGTPINGEDDARAFIEEIRRRHRDATHNCPAYILRGGVKRFSDDGEPGGTAGVPILDVLEKSGITDSCIVVTRYFGGILLGAGGLVRAYSHAAKIAIDACGVAVMTECALMRVSAGYDFYQPLIRMLEGCGAMVDGTDFSENVTVDFCIGAAEADAVSGRIFDSSGGKYTPVRVGTEYRAL